MIRVSLIDLLESKGYEVFEAGDAAQALEVFQVHQIDILLTDIGLPDMSGVELAKAMRKSRPELPVIFATGDETVTGVDLDLRTHVLQKPYGSDSLHQLITALIV